MSHPVFIVGGTGYMGRSLIPTLIERGHSVYAVVRAGSERKLAPGATAVPGDVLDGSTYSSAIPPDATFVQLVGVPHPSPSKAAQFRAIDLVSAQAAIAAAQAARVRHFVYVSVAHPAPAMRAYIQVREECEELIGRSGMNATILRPWYVLGPGHLWPYLLVPGYWLCERLPATRDGALRLGLVTLQQMVHALVASIESPASGIRIVDVPAIRGTSLRRVTSPVLESQP